MLRSLSILIALVILPLPAVAEESYDVVVYGGTAGGVAAAVQTARMGKTVLVLEPGRHVGGLTSGGLGATDIGNKQAIGGIAREFYRRVLKHYSQPDAWKFEKSADYRSDRRKAEDDAMWTFEPHVAEAILREMIAQANVAVHFGERLRRPDGIERAGAAIVAITMETGQRYTAKMFIDASYEGDLMAGAGVAYHVGREDNSVYGETLNGVQLGMKGHQFKVPVDPYRVPGDPASGLVAAIHEGG
ncbi:MAG TPA: FAD-dependent oxidoreductase, partial [Pirellulales bacterium]|nr:FAD-dependent oxidoreductase [Pirellulales bacterium]